MPVEYQVIVPTVVSEIIYPVLTSSETLRKIAIQYYGSSEYEILLLLANPSLGANVEEILPEDIGVSIPALFSCCCFT